MISLDSREASPVETLTTPAPPLASTASAGPRVTSVGTDRVRLLAVDPRVLHCHWQLAPDRREALAAELGSRGAAVCQIVLTVRAGERSARWYAPLDHGSAYLRVVASAAPHEVDLGVVLPSGEVRGLATSDVVVPPPLGAALDAATHTVRVASDERGVRVATTPMRMAAGRPIARALESSRHPALAVLGSSSERLVGASDAFRR